MLKKERKKCVKERERRKCVKEREREREGSMLKKERVLEKEREYRRKVLRLLIFITGMTIDTQGLDT